MASDRGKQQAYCKVCGGIDNVRRHGEGKKHLELFNGLVVPHFFFQKLNMSGFPSQMVIIFFFLNENICCG